MPQFVLSSNMGREDAAKALDLGSKLASFMALGKNTAAFFNGQYGP